MQVFNRLKSIFIFIFLFLNPILLEAMDRGCDLVGKNIGSSKAKSQLECEKQCVSNHGCQGAVFITGWERCFLKAEVKRKVFITLKSAIKGEDIQKNHDFSGKDFKQTDESSAIDCQEKCSKTANCTGFTYIDGYRTCWIKQTKGKLFEKVFYCFQKALPAK